MAGELKPTAPQIQDLAIKLQALERLAFDYGLPGTARAINMAVQRVGWEGADLITRRTPDKRHGG